MSKAIGCPSFTAGRKCHVVTASLAVRRRIGFAGQFATLDDELTGHENLELIARLQDNATVPMIDVRAYAKWLAS